MLGDTIVKLNSVVTCKFKVCNQFNTINDIYGSTGCKVFSFVLFADADIPSDEEISVLYDGPLRRDLLGNYDITGDTSGEDAAPPITKSSSLRGERHSCDCPDKPEKKPFHNRLKRKRPNSLGKFHVHAC